ncbi:MAG: sugar phosphate isomerase/epimerase [Fimbriimonadaceae bacterium]|nr:sugar phosphate isomerase/epimerase [Fimbriimonadaceae bacterium]
MDLARFTTCSYPLRELPFATACQQLAATGLTRLDVWGRQPHFSADPAECDPAACEAAARAAGVRIANLGTYCGHDFDSDDPAKVAAEHAKFVRTIELAQRFGCRSIRILPGHGEAASLVDKVAPHFAQAAALAYEAGIYLGMENHAGSLAGNPALAVRLCQLVDNPVFGVLYEPCNLLHGKTDYRQAFELFAPYITHVHFKDGRWVDGKFERCHLGQGEVDLAWCLAALERSGYSGDFALEYEICDLEPLATGLVKWRQYVEAL